MANAKWLENYQLSNEGKSFFSGGESTVRVRDWRVKNPGYRRQRKTAPSQKNPRLHAPINLRQTAIFDVQQDSIDTFFTLGSDLLARLQNHVQQDSIAKKLRRAILRVHAILRLIAEKSAR